MRIKNPPPLSWPGPAPTQRADVDLLSRIKRRDPEALGDLYDRCGKLAYAIILRIVPEEDVAEDLLAQTFVTVWNQIARWKDARFEDLRLWLLLLARDHAVEYLRTRNEPLPKALPHANALIQPSVLQDFPGRAIPNAGIRYGRRLPNLPRKKCVSWKWPASTA